MRSFITSILSPFLLYSKLCKGVRGGLAETPLAMYSLFHPIFDRIYIVDVYVIWLYKKKKWWSLTYHFDFRLILKYETWAKNSPYENDMQISIGCCTDRVNNGPPYNITWTHITPLLFMLHKFLLLTSNSIIIMMIIYFFGYWIYVLHLQSL